VDVRVAQDAANPALRLDDRQRPRIVFEKDGLGYAVGARKTGGFSVQHVPGTRNDAYLPSLALDSKGNPHISWTRLVDHDREVRVAYAHRTSTGWSWPRTIMADDAPSCDAQLCFRTDSSSIGLDAGGKVHIAASAGTGAWYLTNRSGPFTAIRLHSTTQADAAALRIGSNARPQVAFVIASGSTRGIWFGTRR